MFIIDFLNLKFCLLLTGVVFVVCNYDEPVFTCGLMICVSIEEFLK